MFGRGAEEDKVRGPALFSTWTGHTFCWQEEREIERATGGKEERKTVKRGSRQSGVEIEGGEKREDGRGGGGTGWCEDRALGLIANALIGNRVGDHEEGWVPRS